MRWSPSGPPISPRRKALPWTSRRPALGNVENYPTRFEDYPAFYAADAAHSGTGYAENPATEAPYEPQIVPRGDYTRVLAEFWADGPDSETPPGHWFVIANEVAPTIHSSYAASAA